MTKRIRITQTDRLLREVFKVQEGEIYSVLCEGKGESKNFYMIQSKRKTKTPIVIYYNECEVLKTNN